MGADDLIDFSIIEDHKENIQALPSGRSAKALAQLFTPPLSQGASGPMPSPAPMQDAHKAERQAFEAELRTADEHDDPLDIYDRYVKWTLDTYPSAQKTPQSQLCALLERATHAFQAAPHYKNDPRYLRLWLHYIRLFSDAPREAFAFLARHAIGADLALFYEDFAAWLETAGRWGQADEVYRTGIDRGARPVERLVRKFGDFERRRAARAPPPSEPSSPVLPAVRPALAARADPTARAAGQTANPQAGRPSQMGGAAKSGRQKLAVFSDADGPVDGPDGSANGWDTIGSLAERKKENAAEARPWVGETLKVGRKISGAPKMEIFKDEVSRASPSRAPLFTAAGLMAGVCFACIQTESLPRNEQAHGLGSTGVQHDRPADDYWCSVNPKTGRREVYVAPMSALIPHPEDPMAPQYCLEEIMVRAMGLDCDALTRPARNRPTALAGDGSSSPKQIPAKSEPVHAHPLAERPVFVDIDQNVVAERRVVKSPPFSPEAASKPPVASHIDTDIHVNDENANAENAPLSPSEIARVKAARRARREDRTNRTQKIKISEVREVRGETQTVQTNLDSPAGPRLRRKKGGAEPTMTIHTKEAIEEIYDIFNQPLSKGGESEEQARSDEEDSDDDFTSAGESSGTGRMSCATSEFGDTTAADFTFKTVDNDETTANSGVDDTDGRSVSEWSDFSTSKHVPQGHGTPDAERTEQTTEALPEPQDVLEWTKTHETLVAPTSPEPPTSPFVPVPPGDVAVPTRPYRDAAVVANSRLPFMTPIVEKTESSMGAGTARSHVGKDCFAKTPSRSKGAPAILEDDGEPWSSPFQEINEQDVDGAAIARPVLVDRTKPRELAREAGEASASQKKQEAKRPIIEDKQCNPMDVNIRDTILRQVQPPLSSYEGYCANVTRSFGRGAEIRKLVKSGGKGGKSSQDKTATSFPVDSGFKFPGSDWVYTVKRELGKGAFAPVYLAESEAPMQNQGPAALVGKGDVDPERRMLEALKMEDPPSAWEFYMMRQAKKRLEGLRAADSVLDVYEMHLFADEGYLVEEYRDQGTLLDLINVARAEGGTMDEQLAMFFTIELFRTVEALHAQGVIHGDLKADNVLVRLEATASGGNEAWDAQYRRDGQGGWAAKGITLIDFGRAVDMAAFDGGVQFVADWKTSSTDCAEMRELRPWTFQVDYHGVAGIVHSLLFGRYMETVAERGPGLAAGAPPTYRVKDGLKRYWQADLWRDVFGLLLNPLLHLDAEPAAGARRLPVLHGMRRLRERMEDWLERNSEKGVGLKALVRRMEEAAKAASGEGPFVCAMVAAWGGVARAGQRTVA